MNVVTDQTTAAAVLSLAAGANDTVTATAADTSLATLTSAHAALRTVTA
jgi:hypothetical protein